MKHGGNCGNCFWFTDKGCKREGDGGVVYIDRYNTTRYAFVRAHLPLREMPKDDDCEHWHPLLNIAHVRPMLEEIRDEIEGIKERQE